MNLNSVNIDNIVVSDKLKHSDDGFKYFIRCKEDNIIRSLCIVLPQISGKQKTF